jgi:quaternary ammonium compound-resistance protein SugE
METVSIAAPTPAHPAPAYAAWTGIGAAGTAAVGMIFPGDAASVVKLVAIALILSGVIGLNLSGVTS